MVTECGNIRRAAPGGARKQLRWSMALLLGAFVGVLWACVEQPSRTLVEAGSGSELGDRLSEIAGAIAVAMRSDDVRSGVLKAMRASQGVDHHLILGEYLADPGGAALLAAAATGHGVAESRFLGMVQDLPELEFVVPYREHRLTWTGTAGVGVGAQPDPDLLSIPVYELSGDVREIKNQESLTRARSEYEALFLVHLRENYGTRIDRQAHVPGPVIQDPDDGESAIVWRIQVGDREPVVFDVGRFSGEVELQRAITEAFGDRFRFGPEVDDGMLADSGEGCGEEDPGEEPKQDDCGGGGGGGTGGRGYEVGDPDTWVTGLNLVEKLDLGSDSEIRLTYRYWIPYDWVVSVKDYYNVKKGETPRNIILPG